MTTRAFEVLSSDGISRYTITFSWANPSLTVICSCPAGERGKMCRHKEGLISGDVTRLPDSSDHAKLSEILQWVKDSAVGGALKTLQTAQADFEGAQLTLKRAKKSLEILIQPR